MNNALSAKIEEWSKPPFDAESIAALETLKQNPELLEDAFYKDLEFGTGGMRGIMGIGTNRINPYTLGKSTQGLSDYLKNYFEDEPIKAVIAYDCRNNSKSLAKLVADVFSANGIELNIEKHIVSKNGKTIELTQKEFSLLEYMIRNKGKVCRRTRIIEKVWDIHFDYDNSVIDVKTFKAKGSKCPICWKISELACDRHS
mgnify:CR=1 FL=1